MKKMNLWKVLMVAILFSLVQSEIEAQVQEGDTVKFWSVAYIDWYPPYPPYPPAQYQITAVCRKVGTSCYICFDTLYNKSIKQTDLDNVARTFDSLYYPTFTKLYGANPTGIDGDPKVYILAGSGDSLFAGYFDPLQGMPDSMTFRLWKRHSSQKEIIYVNHSNWYFNENIAHEFGHLLQWGQDHSPEPVFNPQKYWEEAWVDEGFSTFAEYYFQDTFSVADKMYYYKSFPGDYSLIWFESYDPSRLLFSYMYEHFGGDLFLKTLISEQANGIEGFRKTLKKLGYSETFEEIFTNLALACYADDRIYDKSKYGFYHYNFQSLPVLFQMLRQHISYPINNATGNVRAFSSKYVSFRSVSPKPLSIEFSGDKDSKFRLAFLLYQDTKLVGVRNVNPDTNNQCWFGADSFGIAYNRIIMTVVNVDSALGFFETASFKYAASEYKTVINQTDRICMLISPNPANSYITIKTDIQNAFNMTFNIVDQFGKAFKTGFLISSETKIDISSLPPAMYFIKFNNGSQIWIRRFVKE